MVVDLIGDGKVLKHLELIALPLKLFLDQEKVKKLIGVKHGVIKGSWKLINNESPLGKLMNNLIVTYLDGDQTVQFEISSTSSQEKQKINGRLTAFIKSKSKF